MSSPFNRVSRLWSSHLEASEHEVEVVDDQRTKLDRTIDKIGMGSYQWTLLSLCGFGWMADNCWIQATAIILPRVQQHYAVPNSYMGAPSFSLFFGMMFGAVGWGICSDLMGRSMAFNGTLFFSAIFGVLAGFTPDFLWLCVSLFFLGSAVGGSMPTDGTLLLEHMPNGKHHLLTASSVFFSLGAVLAALVGITIIPQNSCPPAAGTVPCDVDKSNMGWKYMLIILGLMTLLMFIARVVFFRLHESPRYLVHAGRPHEAVVSLRKISEFNGDDIRISISDVEDGRRCSLLSARSHHTEEPISAEGEGDCTPRDIPHSSNRTSNYQSTHSSLSPTHDNPWDSNHLNAVDEEPGDAETDPLFSNSEEMSPRLSKIPLQSDTNQCDLTQTKCEIPLCPSSLAARSVAGWLDRISMVLSAEWRTTTLLVWCIWFTISLAYTMFNVFLPKMLEVRGSGSAGSPKTLEQTMWDVVIFTLGGCPGALLGAYLVQSQLGHRLSLLFSTMITAGFCLIFVVVKDHWTVRASTIGISLSSTTMWAVLYGMTPEIFDTKVRGTACGTASALSRVGGMMAPFIGGSLLAADNSFPVYASIVIFTAGSLCVLPLKIGSNLKGDRRMIH